MNVPEGKCIYMQQDEAGRKKVHFVLKARVRASHRQRCLSEERHGTRRLAGESRPGCLKTLKSTLSETEAWALGWKGKGKMAVGRLRNFQKSRTQQKTRCAGPGR